MPVALRHLDSARMVERHPCIEVRQHYVCRSNNRVAGRDDSGRTRQDVQAADFGESCRAHGIERDEFVRVTASPEVWREQGR